MRGIVPMVSDSRIEIVGRVSITKVCLGKPGKELLSLFKLISEFIYVGLRLEDTSKEDLIVLKVNSKEFFELIYAP